MKLSFNVWTVEGIREPRLIDFETLQLMRNYGYEGVELVVDEKHYKPEILLKYKSQLLAKLKELKMEVSSICAGLTFFEYNPGASNEQIRQNSLHAIQNACEVANAFGTKIVLVISGAHRDNLTGGKRKIPYAQLYRNTVTTIREAVKYAEEYNVILALENVWGKFLSSPIEFKQFMDEIDNSDFVKFYLDVGNTLIVGYPEDWIDILGEKIIAVHVKDFVIEDGYPRGFRVCGSGDLDWKSTLGALKTMGYDGYLVAETPPAFLGIKEPSYPNDGLKAGKATIDFLKSVLGSL